MSTLRKKRKTNLSYANEEMDLIKQLDNLTWCKQSWSSLSLSKAEKDMMHQCKDLTKPKHIDDIQEIIKRSNAFPIAFPIETVRLKNLQDQRPEERLKRNIISTYTLIHERVLLLIIRFLIYKRQFGSDIEKTLYKDMTVPQFIDRILKKRSGAFLTARDKYKLLTGEKGSDGWESVGTPEEQPPLVLENCLSYDEMKISAMVFVSGYTESINDGARKNSGVVNEEDIEEEAVIIGVIGARFKREGRMDCEDILITEKQNIAENGYGQDLSEQSAKQQWRKMWSEFYQVPSYNYEELISTINMENKAKDKMYMERFVTIGAGVVFDNEAFYRRMAVLIESTLVEADARGADAGRNVYLNVIGAGLGVWKASKHQEDVYVLAFLERIRNYLGRGLLDHVTDVNFAYIKPGRRVMAMFKDTENSGEKSLKTQKLFIENERHSKGGINVQLESREPTSKLGGEHAGKLLVITYPWDSNAHPGNEFWIGKLGSSGDPAAACSTQISELHNAHINPALGGHNVRVATRTGLATLQDCCRTLTT